MKKYYFKKDFEKVIGNLNILLMMKEPINVIINDSLDIYHPVSCLFDSEHQNIVFKAEHEVLLIPYWNLESIEIERINDYES